MRLRTRAGDGGGFPVGRLLLRYVAIVVSATAILTAYAGWKNGEDLRSSLQQACEDTRGPLTNYFTNQIEAVRQTDPELFPDIPPVEFERLIQARVDGLKHVRNAFDAADCENLYD